MGVNTFGLKLLAFAMGAFLAGLAGTIKAHQDDLGRARTSTSSWSRRSCSPRSCSAAWAPSPACSSARRS